MKRSWEYTSATEEIADLKAEVERLRGKLDRERAENIRLRRIEESLRKIADPEVFDANWRAMREEAREALEGD